MRKAQIDLDAVESTAYGVLERASSDPSFADLIAGNPGVLAQNLGLAASTNWSDQPLFTKKPGEFCIDIPGLNIHVCLPVGGTGF